MTCDAWHDRHVGRQVAAGSGGHHGLVADEDDRVLGVGAGVRERARGPPRWGRGRRPSRRRRRGRRCGPGVPVRDRGRGHDRVSRTPRPRTTAGRLQLDRLAAVVPAAGRADPVRQLRLVAVRALDELRQGDREVAPALHLSRVSDLSLGHTHGGSCSLCEAGDAGGPARRSRGSSTDRSGRADAPAPDGWPNRESTRSRPRRRTGTRAGPRDGGRWARRRGRGPVSRRSPHSTHRPGQSGSHSGAIGSWRLIASATSGRSSSSWWSVRRGASGSPPSSSGTGARWPRSIVGRTSSSIRSRSGDQDRAAGSGRTPPPARCAASPSTTRPRFVRVRRTLPSTGSARTMPSPGSTSTPSIDVVADRAGHVGHQPGHGERERIPVGVHGVARAGPRRSSPTGRRGSLFRVQLLVAVAGRGRIDVVLVVDAARLLGLRGRRRGARRASARPRSMPLQGPA